MSKFGLSCIWISVCLCMCWGAPPKENIRNKEVNREIDLKHNILSVSTKVKIENEASEEVKVYTYAIPIALRDNLVDIVPVREHNHHNQILPIKQVEHNKEFPHFLLFEITLNTGVKIKEVETIHVTELYKHRFRPLPESITIHAEHMIEVWDYKYYPTIYLTNEQTTTYTNSEGFEGHSTEDAKVAKEEILYGPFKEMVKWKDEMVRIHFISDMPYVIFPEVTREIEISLWGNTQVREEYELHNNAAKLKGGLSRIDYNAMRNPNIGKSAVKSLFTKWPKNAFGLYYRDVIGNVSTSHAFRAKERNNVFLQIDPRFPIFGGWKNKWELGYNLPIEVKVDPNDQEFFVFNFKFGHSFMEHITENYTLKIILPSGADFQEIKIPFETPKHTIEEYFSYLDIKGRTVVVINKLNIHSMHNKSFQITFRVSFFDKIKKPFILIFFFAVLFAFTIVALRMQFTLKTLKVPTIVATKSVNTNYEFGLDPDIDSPKNQLKRKSTKKPKKK